MNSKMPSPNPKKKSPLSQAQMDQIRRMRGEEEFLEMEELAERRAVEMLQDQGARRKSSR